MSAQTLNLLTQLIEENQGFGSPCLFLSNYGAPLTSNHFRHRLQRHARKAGLEIRIYPHLFRHTAATMFIESGGDIAHLQRILGHADLRMVLRYTHLDTRALKEQHDQHSPLHNVLGKLSRRRRTVVTVNTTHR